MIRWIFIVFVFVSIFPINSYASESPNNKFGIHLAQPSDEDIDRTDALVNANGGAWGYITLVIHEDDRSLEKWQSIFDKLREKKLIPLIRLATSPQGDVWKRPNSNEAQAWVDFLNKLQWVVKDRYIILFNEPNHASEWGGSVNATEFAEVNIAFAKELKKANSDFFVMMGGLDLSAPSALPRYEDAESFLQTVVNHIGTDDFNTYFDGLASHAYPNPGFVGSPYGVGRKSVRGYEWELAFLKSLGVQELPVFITETGWNGDVLTRSQIAQNFLIAYKQVWLPDDRVRAVTPFILNYQGEPFLKFSWVSLGNGAVHPEYLAVQAMEKSWGVPELEEKGSIKHSLPGAIVEKSTYHFQLEVENAGQGIWGSEYGYSLKIQGIPESTYLISELGTIKRGESRMINVYLNTGQTSAQKQVRFDIMRGGKPAISSDMWEYEVVPLPSLTYEASLFPQFSTTTDGFELQLFDEYEQMIYSNKRVVVMKGKGSVSVVENIALGKPYRVVLLKKYYLPRQTYVTFTKGKNSIRFEPMLPLDFDGDGAFRWGDVPALFQNLHLIRNLFP